MERVDLGGDGGAQKGGVIGDEEVVIVGVGEGGGEGEEG